ncbi:MAG: phosphotransferase [Bacteroidales bacterium]|nr:phosphotransferase [Bacteroidales bacterium]MBQ6576909.1 phosphotransferase [Bacteroidales bacterium]
MEPIKISLDDYVLFGGGANGESYDLKDDPSVMLKLYFPGKIQQPLDEMNLARKVYALGIPTPEPGDYVVTGDGRYGIRFHRILGKTSYARACGENPSKVPQYAAEFASMCRKLHSVHVDTTQFENVKDRYLQILSDSPYFTSLEKERITKFILDTPDADTAIHGDLQFGNAIFVGEDRYFIDLGDFCYGHPYFDLGMLYLCCKLSGEAFTKEIFHMDNATASRFWDCFVPEYFGKDVPPREIEEKILPYAALKTIIIDRDSGCRREEFHEILDKTVI